MTGGIVGLSIAMLIIAAVAFAPLGYFIYMYTMKNGEPFGETERHGDSESKVLDIAEALIHQVKSLIGKK
jgi:uncharacterized membrane protein